MKQEGSKHQVRPAYFVTEVDQTKKLLKAKKMLHIHTQIPTKFQNKTFEIKLPGFVLAKSQILPKQYPIEMSDDDQLPMKQPRNLLELSWRR